MVVKNLRVVNTGVLRAGVGMGHQLKVSAGSAEPERHPQRVEHQRGAHVLSQLPADDHPAEHVDDEAEVQHPLPAAQIREIAHPEPVRGAGGEVAPDEIISPRGARVCPSGPPRLPTPLRTDDPVHGHQPLHLTARDWLTGTPQRLPHPPIPVREVVLRVRVADHAEQPLVLHRASGPLAAGTLVVRRRRHAQGLTDGLDPEAVAMGIDIRAHLVRSWSSSLAKNTEADLRISFARRRSCTSRRSLRISSRSSVLNMFGRDPLSASA